MADVIHNPPARPVADGRVAPAGAEPALGDLFRQLAEDSATLVRQELALAKAELRENVKSAGRNAAMVAVGGVLATVGALVLVAFLVLLLGDAIGKYWAGALIVGLLLVIVGAVLAKKSLGNLKHEGLAPEQTLKTLKEDKQWLQSETNRVRRDLA